jgi:hypothetical protein
LTGEGNKTHVGVDVPMPDELDISLFRWMVAGASVDADNDLL